MRWIPHAGLPRHGAEPTFSAFQANIVRAGVADLVQTHVRTSAEVAREFGQPVELIYIDGAHDYPTVLADFTAWFPHVIDGGVMAFHDTVGYPGPRRLVRDHVYRSRRFRRIRLAGSLTYAEKVTSNTLVERFANAIRWRIHQAYAAAVFVATRLRVRTVLEGMKPGAKA